MVTLEQVVYVLPILGLTESIFYYAMVIRNQNRTRQAALFAQIYNKFGEVKFARNYTAVMKWKFNDFNDWVEKYCPETNPEENSQWMSVARFFHGVGVLVDRGLVDIQLVYDLMGDHVIDAWEKMRVITLTNRERTGSSDHGAAFEKLYKKLKELKT
jgi:hypothetical protein